jgi:hypothetical protein
MTTNKSEKWLPNPTGKGGFKDNPDNINRSGYWDSTMSISFQYKRFMKMTNKEFVAFGKLPDDDKTVAMMIAYSQVLKSRSSLNHAKEVTDRTEGKAPQSIDLTSKGEQIRTALVEFVGDDGTNNPEN